MKLSNNQRTHFAFWTGWALVANGHGFFQDLIGRERYLEWARNTWVNTPPIIHGMFLVIALTSVVYLIISRDKSS